MPIAPVLTLRSADDADIPDIIAANNANIPAVSNLDADIAKKLLDAADIALVAEVEGAFAGFIFALPDGLDDFSALNYRWFEENLDSWLYVERVVVADGNQGRGIGRKFYDHLMERTDRRHLVSEVNTNPRNDASLAFHDRFDFEPIGELTYGDDITCVKLARTI
ncbi:MAG: putative GNAT superfamily acetyltransferase [Glaciecola sp.]|jgi:predicted GNAT superfamily acetyltransferase